MKNCINVHRRLWYIILLFILIMPVNFKCLMVGHAPAVNIRSDIVELKHPISGSVGFCSIFEYRFEGSLPFSQGFGGCGIDLNNLNKDLLDIIGNKITVDCRYDRIKEGGTLKVNPPHHGFVHVNGLTVKGYILFYDEKDAYGNWKMWRGAYVFLNEHFKCDYYLTGKFNFVFTNDSDNKRIGIEPNFLLIIYDYRGFRVWSKLYKKQYYYVEKDLLTADKLYSYVKNMLNDNKELINNDLSSIIVSNEKK